MNRSFKYVKWILVLVILLAVLLAVPVLAEEELEWDPSPEELAEPVVILPSNGLVGDIVTITVSFSGGDQLHVDTGNAKLIQQPNGCYYDGPSNFDLSDQQFTCDYFSTKWEQHKIVFLVKLPADGSLWTYISVNKNLWWLGHFQAGINVTKRITLNPIPTPTPTPTNAVIYCLIDATWDTVSHHVFAKVRFSVNVIGFVFIDESGDVVYNDSQNHFAFDYVDFQFGYIEGQLYRMYAKIGGNQLALCGEVNGPLLPTDTPTLIPTAISTPMPSSTIIPTILPTATPTPILIPTTTTVLPDENHIFVPMALR